MTRTGIRGLVAAAAAVGVLSLAAACSGSPVTAPTSSAAVDMSTPDGVAAAFSTAYAAGDTPTACKYASSYGLQRLSVGGPGSLCARPAWAPQEFHVVNQCDAPASDHPNHPHSNAHYWWVYALGDAGADAGFMIEVSGADRSWTVSNYTAGTAAVAGQICYKGGGQ